MKKHVFNLQGQRHSFEWVAETFSSNEGGASGEVEWLGVDKVGKGGLKGW